MPSQLVYTSAPRGLVSGQSGFCVVARTADLREALAQRLEQLSSYHYLEVTKAGTAGANPIISAYRILDVRGAKYHILTRIQPSGLDFTARTNHLAQHLVFLPEELPKLPPPAAILRDWEGWLGSWQGDPRILEPLGADCFARIPAPSWPARNWAQLTGDAGRAAGLLEPEVAGGCYLAIPRGAEQQVLALFCETTQLLNPDRKSPLRPWQYTFTTFLQATDAVTEFQWRGCRPGSPGADLVARRGVSLTELSSVRVPDNALAKLAREGPALQVEKLKGRVTLRNDDVPARTLPRPSVPGLDGLTGTRSIRAGRPVGTYLVVNTNTVRALAVALVLLLLLLGILSKLHLFPFKSGAAVTLPSSNSVSLATSKPPQFATPVPATSPAPADLASSRLSAAQTVPSAQLEEFERFPEVPTYVVVAQSLDPGASLPLNDIPPLTQLLENFHKINLRPDELDLRFAHGLWELPSVMERLQVKSSPAERKLVAATSGGFSHFEAQVAFDYSAHSEASGVASPARAEIFVREPAKSLSLLFRPAAGVAANFQPFRILFVNAALPPPPLYLRKDQLNLEAQNTSTIVSSGLHKRLDWWQSVQWHLRPADADCQNLYASWPVDEQPRPGEELALAAVADRLKTRRASLAEQVTNAAGEIEVTENSMNDKVNESLPIGSWLKLDKNPELKSFSEFRGSQPQGTRSAASLLPDYLDQLKKQAGSQYAWVREQWPALRGKSDHAISEALSTIYELCEKNIEKKASALALSGSNPNYFQALWKNLGLEDHRADAERKKLALESEISRLDAQLHHLPATLSDSPCLTLCLVTGDNKPLEVIRFRGP